MKYIKGLDTLRAIAITIVIISHWGPRGFKSGILTFFFTKIIPEGTFGVDLFFVLSGYLISRILLTARAEAPEDKRLTIIKNFYIRRALRIFPIYFLYVLVLAFILKDTYIRGNILYFITYTTNFLVLRDGHSAITHTWSLAAEEQFYLIWPWIMIYTPKRYLFSVILVTLCIGLASTFLFQFIYGIYGMYVPLTCFTAFAIGALYSYVEINPRFKKVTVNTFLLLLPGCLILLFLHRFGNQFILIRAVNSIVSITVIIYVCRQNYNRLTKSIFNSRLLSNIGKISYGMYLYHLQLPYFYYAFINYLQQQFAIGNKTLKILTLPTSAYVIYLGLLFLISALSYRYIELAFLKLKRYFLYTPDKKVVVVTTG